MKRFVLSTIPLLIFCVGVLAQTPGRTPEKKRQDSIEAAAFQRTYPQLFRYNRLPVLLKDSSVEVDGFCSSINLRHNYVVDSIHTNFHPNMPDTSTVSPFSAIKVAGPRVTVSFSHMHFLDGLGFGSITPVDSEERRTIRPTMILNLKITEYIRLLLNGKPLFDWKPLDSFPRVLCKFYQEVALPHATKPMGMSMYDYAYQCCDTVLSLDDRLTLELKTEPQNWMVDRYIITRVASSPEIKPAFVSPSTSGNISVEETGGLEKKTTFVPTSGR